jgi:phosphatidylglycerophosphatase A
VTKDRARARVCEWYATCCYIGHLPFAPGTWASLLGCILVYAYPPLTNPFVIVLLTIAGIAASERERREDTDPGRVVIDELVGMLITLAGHSTTPWGLLKGFILFRAFDILKPYPIRKLERLPGGYGIIADDVLAGVFASAALFIWEWLI